MLDLFFRKYAWTANLALLLAGAWLVAKTVNTLVGAVIRPRPTADLSIPVSAARAPPPVVLDDARLYHLIGVEPPAQVDTTAAPVVRRAQNCQDQSASPVRTELRLSLVAGVVAENRRSSLATVADLNTRQTFVVGVGDRVQGAELLGLERIQTDGDVTGNAFKVVALLCNAGTKEYVDFEGSVTPEAPVAASAGMNLGTAPVPRPAGSTLEGVRSVGANRYEIDRKVIDSTLNDMSKIAVDARIVPSFKNGVANGFKLFSIQPGSLYSSIGVENGDVIQRINGYEINSPEKALELYQKLRESSHVTIELERNGAPVRKEYTITGP
jgi:general secretion pathway protein C